MLEFLDGTDLHNEIRLLLKSGTDKIIVVEGEDDYDLLVETFEAKGVALVPGYGKPKTLQAAAEAEAEGTEPVRFLVDADFDRLTGADAQYSSNVFATAHYDLAMDAIEHLSAVVPRMARFASGKAKPATISAEGHGNLILSVAEQFGLVRFVSHVCSWNLAFSKFPFHTILPDDESSHSISLPDTVSILVARTGACELEPAHLCRIVPTHAQNITQARSLVNSHDLFAILLQVGLKFGGAKSTIGYETQFKLAAAGSMSVVPVVRKLVEWAEAA